MGAWIDHGKELGVSSRVFLTLVNLVIFGQDIVVFLNMVPKTGALQFASSLAQEPTPGYLFLAVPVAWSLGVELSFYLMAPVLVRLQLRFQLCLILISLTARAIGFAFGLNQDPWIYRFFPFELAIFLLGSVAYQNYDRFGVLIARLTNFVSSFGRWFLYALIACYGALVGKTFLNHYLILALVFISLPILFAATKDSQWDRFIGELSYPFYLVHWIIFSTLGLWLQAHVPHSVAALLVLISTLLASILIFLYFESFVENWRHKLLNRKRDSKDVRGLSFFFRHRNERTP